MRQPLDRWLDRLLAGYWAVYLALEFGAARLARIDYYDAFLYLSDARHLAGAPITFANKPLLLPLLHWPLQALLDRLGAGLEARLWAPHLLEACISLACLAAFYAWLKRRLPRRWAQLGVVVFSLDRMMVHYFWSILPDIASALMLLLALLWEEDGSAIAAAAALAAAMLCRPNMAVLPPLILLGMAWQRRARRDLARFAAVCAGAGATYAAAYVLLVMRAFGLGPIAGLAMTVSGLRHHYGTTAAARSVVSWLGYPKALLAAAGPFAFLAAGAGLALTLARRRREDLLPVVVLLGYLAVMTIAIPYQEARYVLPIMPIFYLMAVKALHAAYQSGACERPRWQAAAPAAIVLAASLAFGTREFARFLDPVYRDPLLLRAADALAAAAPSSGRMLWRTEELPPLGTPDVFIPEDHFFYAYCLPNRESMEYLLARPIPQYAGSLASGDVLVRLTKGPAITLSKRP